MSYNYNYEPFQTTSGIRAFGRERGARLKFKTPKRRPFHRTTAHQQLRRVRGSGQAAFEPLDHILTWPSLNSQSSQKLLRLICCSIL